MSRYRFIKTDNKIICLSTYAKKPVRGVAKCSPTDEFDFEIGAKLAKLRCDVKVCEKRLNNARYRYSEAVDILNKAMEHYDNMWEYLMDSFTNYKESEIELKEFEKNT